MKTKRPRRKQHKRGDTRRKSRTLRPRTADDFFALPEEAQTDWEDTRRVLARMRSDRSLSLTKAAKQEKVNPRTVSRLGRQALRKRSNGRYYVTKRDSLLRVMKVITPEGAVEVAISNSQDASLNGQHWDAVEKDSHGDQSALAKLEGKFVKDMNGNKYPLITDHEVLQRLRRAGVLSFESLYGKST